MKVLSKKTLEIDLNLRTLNLQLTTKKASSDGFLYYPNITFRSSSGVDTGLMLNLSTKT